MGEPTMKRIWLAAAIAAFSAFPTTAEAEQRMAYQRWPGKPPGVLYDVKYVKRPASRADSRAALRNCPIGTVKAKTSVRSLFAKWPVVYVRERTYVCVD